MFNVGGGELLVILLVALIVLGPTKLPDAARQFGRVMTELRRLSSGFQREMRAALDDPIEAAARDRGKSATMSTAAAAGMYPEGDPDGPPADAETSAETDAPSTDDGDADGTGDDSADASGEATAPRDPPTVRRTTDLPTTTVFRPRTVEPPDEVEAAGG